VRLDDRIIGHLVGLYEVHAGPVVPQRSELILDIDRQQLMVGSDTESFASLHSDDVLERYVSLIYRLRGLNYGSDLVLRDRDLEVLSRSLGQSPATVRDNIYGLIAAPESVQRAKSVSKATMIAAAGVLVGVTAIGTLVLVGSSSGGSPTEVLGTQQTITSSFATGIGAQAESTIDYDFRSALSDWQIGFADDHPDFLGVTLSEEKVITVHVQPGASVETIAAVLMHEVGHAEMRDMPATWWPGNGLSDFAVGAGDFAEAVSAVTTGSASGSTYGEFTPEQLAFVADILENG